MSAPEARSEIRIPAPPAAVEPAPVPSFFAEPIDDVPDALPMRPYSPAEQSAASGAAAGATGNPLLSVIVCTFKRPEMLRGALASLQQATLSSPHFEIIVVDNNSEDATESVVAEAARAAANLRYVREREQGLSHARNRGYAEARAEYLVYIDDDARVHADYLSLIHETIRDFRPDIMGGPIYPFYTEPKPGWFKDEYEIRCHARATGWSASCSISGSSFVIRRTLLYELGLFDPELGMKGSSVRLGEERAVLNRYRERPHFEQRVFYHLGAVVYHHVPLEKMTPHYLLKRYYKAGKAKAEIEGVNRRRWGPGARMMYVLRPWARSVKERVRKALHPKRRRAFKQRCLERGLRMSLELGRIAGCMPRFPGSRRSARRS
ncbi:MAG: glycosyltransferase family 2 protein [Planctomycetes bacterium]|nr:glycosyltransferase family 2 protein [Planctomycetota bacterium]